MNKVSLFFRSLVNMKDHVDVQAAVSIRSGIFFRGPNVFILACAIILASTLFYLLSPLQLQQQTELLARTNPTIYDVLIALFGGFAGILENSRKEKGGTVIPGVAIATALMPPLIQGPARPTRAALVAMPCRSGPPPRPKNCS